MKSDLDTLMQTRDLDVLLVIGNSQHNPPMYYFTGGGHINSATLIKKRNEEPMLFHADMERDEASKSGLITKSYNDYPLKELVEEAGGDHTLAWAIRLQRMLADLGIISGRIGLYGQAEVSSIIAILDHLRELMPKIKFVGDKIDSSILMTAMETKGDDEVERIRKMGEITTQVVGRVADYLSDCEVRADEVLLREDGNPLTIANIKSRINLWLAECNVENPEGTIFAIGRDAGVPHTSGTPNDPIRLGQTIIFDIFPCEAGGGYYYDFTRTWCLGYASEEALKLHEQVLSVFQTVLREMKVGNLLKECQRRTCELFEAMGHPTVLNNAQIREGYVHSLSHGLGLHIHERPWSGLLSGDDNILKPGTVLTLEPGLYYPEKGMGVRIEDTIWVKPDGQIVILASYPYDLVLPMKRWNAS